MPITSGSRHKHKQITLNQLNEQLKPGPEMVLIEDQNPETVTKTRRQNRSKGLNSTVKINFDTLKLT